MKEKIKNYLKELVTGNTPCDELNDVVDIIDGCGASDIWDEGVPEDVADSLEYEVTKALTAFYKDVNDNPDQLEAFAEYFAGVFVDICTGKEAAR